MSKFIGMIILIIPSLVYGWGQPASATATVEANITGWTENPCNYGDRYREQCEYAKQHNLFPDSMVESHPATSWTSLSEPNPTVTTTTDYGTFTVQETTTHYE